MITVKLPDDQIFVLHKCELTKLWIAQGIPADIVVQGKDIFELGRNLHATINAECVEAAKRGQEIPRRARGHKDNISLLKKLKTAALYLLG